MFQTASHFAVGLRQLTLIIALFALPCVCVQSTAAAQPVPTLAATGLRLFPNIAAPGEQVWLYGAVGRAALRTVWIGGKSAPLVQTTPAGWLSFTVPRDAAPGSQSVSFGAQRGNPQILLTVLDPELEVQSVVLYVNPAAFDNIRREYRARLVRLLESCQRSCPAELTVTLRQLVQKPLPDFTPLSARVTGQGTEPRVAARFPLLRTFTTVPSELSVQNLDSRRLLPSLTGAAVVEARKNNFCDQLAGLLPTTGLPTGQVIALLNLLFQGDLSIDPGTFGHPSQTSIPYQNEKPRTVVEKVLGISKGSGRGVAIHVLDTASPTADAFTMDEPVLYYDLPPIPNRPYHGRVVGEIAQAVAPDANVVYRQICTLPGMANGDCSTLETVKALCAVAAEARKGGKHVVNLSLGGSYPTLGLKLALREVASVGVPTVASYGNRDDCVGHALGDQCHHFPADWSGEFMTGTAPGSPTMLLSVAGWDIRADLQEFATYNRAVVIPWAQTPLPSVQAPGEFWSGGMPYFGTSFAAPVVSGVLAGWMSCNSGVPSMPLVTTPRQNPLASVLNACP